jgi:PIN domain nuclease of toxin-antitoxin system
MGFLLDTHAFLWFLGGDKKLPKPSRKIIKDINQDCYLSVASLWEMTIISGDSWFHKYPVSIFWD